MPPVSPGEAGVSPHAPPRPTPQNQGGNAPGLMAELEGVPGFAGCEPQVQATGRGVGISNIYPKVKQVGPGGHYKQLPLALYKQRDASHHRGGLGNPRGGRASPRTAAPAPSPPGLCCADPTPRWATDRPQLPQGLAGSKPQPPHLQDTRPGSFLRSGVTVAPSAVLREGERLGCAIQGPSR